MIWWTGGHRPLAFVLCSKGFKKKQILFCYSREAFDQWPPSSPTQLQIHFMNAHCNASPPPPASPAQVAQGVDPSLKDDRGYTARESTTDMGAAHLLQQLEDEQRGGDVRRSRLVQSRVQVAQVYWPGHSAAGETPGAVSVPSAPIRFGQLAPASCWNQIFFSSFVTWGGWVGWSRPSPPGWGVGGQAKCAPRRGEVSSFSEGSAEKNFQTPKLTP